MSSTLFSHLVQRFSHHPENLATEALLYLLNNARDGNDIFGRYCRDAGTTFKPVVRFSSQVFSENETIPDLVGTDESGRNVFIIENKFWAELTSNQPLGYLPLLPADDTSALIFVCPEKRLPLLHSELARLLDESGQYTRRTTLEQSNNVTIERLTGSKYMVLLSWRRLLSDLEVLLDPVEERTLIEDLRQLQGLCEQMDSEGFIPLRPGETGNLEIPRRIMNYRDVVDGIVQLLVETSEASTRGLASAASAYSSGRYMDLRTRGDFQALLAVDFSLWRKFGLSPIWLKFHYGEMGRATEVAALLSKTHLSVHYVEENPRLVATPILLSPSSDRQKVILDGAEQIRFVNNVLLDY